jgi:hypothetical protein
MKLMSFQFARRGTEKPMNGRAQERVHQLDDGQLRVLGFREGGEVGLHAKVIEIRARGK